MVSSPVTVRESVVLEKFSQYRTAGCAAQRECSDGRVNVQIHGVATCADSDVIGIASTVVGNPVGRPVCGSVPVSRTWPFQLSLMVARPVTGSRFRLALGDWQVLARMQEPMPYTA